MFVRPGMSAAKTRGLTKDRSGHMIETGFRWHPGGRPIDSLPDLDRAAGYFTAAGCDSHVGCVGQEALSRDGVKQCCGVVLGASARSGVDGNEPTVGISARACAPAPALRDLREPRPHADCTP